MTTFHDDGTALIVNFGGGIDSTALLIGMLRLWQAGDETARPDLIIFADTGNEIRETYEHVEAFSTWLQDRGFPAVTRASRWEDISPDGHRSIQEKCRANETLPSEAFSRNGSCSTTWKHDAMNRVIFGSKRPLRKGWLQRQGFAEKPTKLIGYNADEASAGKRSNNIAKNENSDEATFRYPLVEWGWSRQDCVDVCEAEGLSVRKSACAICPNQKPHELNYMVQTQPGLFLDALVTEEIARYGVHGLVKIDGLWRAGTKTRPGSWVEHGRRTGLLASAEARAGRSLIREVHAAFVAKLANLEDGGRIPFTAGTIHKVFGTPDPGDRRKLTPEERDLVALHYRDVIDRLAAQITATTSPVAA